MKSVRYQRNIFLPSLLDVVNPSILKLIEEEDKQGMAQLGPFFSNPLSEPSWDFYILCCSYQSSFIMLYSKVILVLFWNGNILLLYSFSFSYSNKRSLVFKIPFYYLSIAIKLYKLFGLLLSLNCSNSILFSLLWFCLKGTKKSFNVIFIINIFNTVNKSY